MRLATIATARGQRLHVKGTEGYVDVADATGDERLGTLAGVLGGGLEGVRRAAERPGTEVQPSELAPAVPAPNRILCLGVNYLDHAEEGGRSAPTWPESFVRGAGSVAAPYGDLVRPALSRKFDYEGELGVVVGRGGRYLRAAEALGAVFGFVVLNDGSARDWQWAASQWTPGKNFDATMPIGPEVVTADEVDVADLQLTTTLNGQVMQQARTSQMIVDVPHAIEYLSSFTTLRPGDVIATGTPGGVGFAQKPPRWLQPGDLVEVTIEGIGRIANRIVAEDGDVAGWPWDPPPGGPA